MVILIKIEKLSGLYVGSIHIDIRAKRFFPILPKSHTPGASTQIQEFSTRDDVFKIQEPGMIRPV
jgi:hypothetical protein